MIETEEAIIHRTTPCLLSLSKFNPLAVLTIFGKRTKFYVPAPIHLHTQCLHLRQDLIEKMISVKRCFRWQPRTTAFTLGNQTFIFRYISHFFEQLSPLLVRPMLEEFLKDKVSMLAKLTIYIEWLKNICMVGLSLLLLLSAMEAMIEIVLPE